MLNSNAIYNALTGWSTYYYSFGGEIGNNDSTERFKVKGLPYGSASTKEMNESASGSDTANEVITDKGGTRIISNGDKSWVSNPWIGELYPDEKFSSWLNNGNLESKISLDSNSFIKLKINDSFKGINPDGSTTSTTFYPNAAQKRFASYGASMFFNGSADKTNRAKTFNHLGTDNATAKITSIAGNDIVQKYNLPLSETLRVDRAYSLVDSSGKHALWNHSEFTNTKTILSFIPPLTGDEPQSATDESTVFYYKQPKTDNQAGSAIIRVDAPYRRTSAYNGNDKTPSRSYVVLNAMAPQGTESKSILAKYSLTTMLHAFFSSGNISNNTSDIALANRVVQIPKVYLADTTTNTGGWLEGETPKEGTELDSNSVKIEWNTRWLRWDDKPYTSNYPVDWKESNISLKYNISYSIDNGNSWKYIQDNQNVKYIGVLDDSSSHVINATSSDVSQSVFKKSFIWNVSSLPDGKYMFKVECFRVDDITGRVLKNHSSFHKREIVLRRS